MQPLHDYLKKTTATVNERLLELIDITCEPGILKDAMSYSLTAGGKRLRPALCLMSAGIFGDERLALDIACAIEMIHTYSLIHDDLPAMDNDSMRRGKPTNHVVFGEAYAILAGDGLLNCAFEVMLNCAQGNSGLNYIKAMDIIAGASGSRGMIVGQALDMEFEGKEKDEQALFYIHERKTAALIEASVLSGAALFGAKQEEMSALKTYGQSIGIVFQIVDDILDKIGDADKVGKTLGKDSGADKQTFLSVYGLEKSRQIAKRKTEEAIGALGCLNEKADNLRSLARFLLERDR